MSQVLTALILFLACSAITYAQHAKDIIGLTIGMPLDAAKAKIGSRFKIQPLKSNDPAMTYLVAYTPDANEVWSIQAINDKVVYLLHTQDFPPGNQPLTADVFKNLVTKYGEPGTPNGLLHNPPPLGDFGGGYVFDQNGNPLPWGKYAKPQAPMSPPETCDIHLDSFGGAMVVNAKRVGSFPGRFMLGCHQILMTHAGTGGGFVGFLAIYELDQDAEIQEIQRLQEVQKQRDQKKVDDAKKIKVPM